jgi:glyoxylase-like metal-dependent hydrolase (beta-lactamase superfamily II)
MFSGDTLFAGAVGRIDLPGGNLQNMRDSLHRIGALPGDRTVYCGHYESTTLDRERRYSPYLTKR